jgi:hypothetical protein
MTYAEKLKDPRWQKRRLEILERDNFTCLMCGDTSTELHVHHDSYSENPWDSVDDELATYCKHCHSLVEYLKQTPFIINFVIKKWTSTTNLTLYAIGLGETSSLYVYEYNNGKIKQICVIPSHTLREIFSITNPIENVI